MNEEIKYFPLASKVLAVSVANYKEDGTLFDWTAYIDAVEGYNHENEYSQVARMGSKLPLAVAVILFPNLDGNKWRS